MSRNPNFFVYIPIWYDRHSNNHVWCDSDDYPRKYEPCDYAFRTYIEKHGFKLSHNINCLENDRKKSNKFHINCFRIGSTAVI